MKRLKEVDLQCLREIPLDDRHCYLVELPLYVLHCYKTDMIVSDFSSISNSILAGNSIKASGLPRRYQLKNRVLELDYLFYVVVDSCLRDQLLSMRSSDQTGQFYQLGICIVGEIQVSIALDGVYGKLLQWRPFDSEIFKYKNFIQRFKLNVDDKIYDMANKYYKFDNHEIKREFTGSQLLFRNVQEDSQASLFPATQFEDSLKFGPDRESDKESAAEVGENKLSSNQNLLEFHQEPALENCLVKDKSITQESQLKLLPQTNSSNPQGNLPPIDELIKQSTIESLLKMDITEQTLNINQIYQISGCLIGFIPNKPFIIKPFNRTVKFGKFKLIFLSQSYQIPLEFNLENEICKFLKLNEVEEIFNHFDSIDSKFNSLFVKHKIISIQTKLSKIKLNNRIYLYWTCLNDIDELLHEGCNDNKETE